MKKKLKLPKSAQEKFVPVRIFKDLCKGCGLCVEVCPKKLIHISREKINRKGYQPAQFDDPYAQCVYCAQCAIICPDLGIEIVREED